MTGPTGFRRTALTDCQRRFVSRRRSILLREQNPYGNRLQPLPISPHYSVIFLMSRAKPCTERNPRRLGIQPNKTRYQDQGDHIQAKQQTPDAAYRPYNRRFHQVGRSAAHPIKRPDHQSIAVTQRFQARFKTGALIFP